MTVATPNWQARLQLLLANARGCGKVTHLLAVAEPGLCDAGCALHTCRIHPSPCPAYCKE